jgi:hypothetical protein
MGTAYSSLMPVAASAAQSGGGGAPLSAAHRMWPAPGCAPTRSTLLPPATGVTVFCRLTASWLLPTGAMTRKWDWSGATMDMLQQVGPGWEESGQASRTTTGGGDMGQDGWGGQGGMQWLLEGSAQTAGLQLVALHGRYGPHTTLEASSHHDYIQRVTSAGGHTHHSLQLQRHPQTAAAPGLPPPPPFAVTCLTPPALCSCGLDCCRLSATTTQHPPLSTPQLAASPTGQCPRSCTCRLLLAPSLPSKIFH